MIPSIRTCVSMTLDSAQSILREAHSINIFLSFFSFSFLPSKDEKTSRRKKNQNLSRTFGIRAEFANGDRGDVQYAFSTTVSYVLSFGIWLVFNLPLPFYLPLPLFLPLPLILPLPPFLLLSLPLFPPFPFAIPPLFFSPPPLPLLIFFSPPSPYPPEPQPPS